jgi:type II secretory pathway pseudopilin PulG
MKKKYGITMSVLVVAIAVMMILITSAAVIGSNSIKTANYDDYMANLTRTSDSINAYYLKNNKLPVTGEIVSAASLGSDFYAAIAENGDQGNKLFVVDYSLLEDSTIKIGKGTIANKDKFLVADNSHNVYYIKGFNYKGKNIYSIKI